MTKTKKTPAPVKPTYEEVDAKMIVYRNLYEQAIDLKHKMDQIEAEIAASCEQNPEWFDDKHRLHFECGYVERKLTSVVVMPADMQSADAPKLIRFCKKHPGSVKFELVKSKLTNIDLKMWGISIEQQRKININW